MKARLKVVVPEHAEASPRGDGFLVTALQRRSLSVEPVRRVRFVPTRTAEGKIAVNENKSTPVFSPFSGARVLKVFANTGEIVAAGAPLLRVESPDLVQAASDLTTAAAALDKARGQVHLATLAEARQRALYEARATALKDWQQAQADLTAVRNDQRGAEGTLAAARNRLGILGKRPADIAMLESHQAIDPAVDIVAPIGGVVVQRKVGPGQYLAATATDPLYVLGDLSSVWLLASVRESDVSAVKVGQAVSVRVLAFPDRAFTARIVAVAAAIDPTTRRLSVRAEVENPDSLLKPEMFAEFSIETGEAVESTAVPAIAIVREGETARIWVQIGDDRFAARSVVLGIEAPGSVQVLSGLQPDDRVVTRGALFIDRAANPD